NSFYRIILLDFYSVVKFVVHQNTATVFANNDLLPLTDFTLHLWRNCIEATTAGISFHRHHRQTVSIILSDTIVAVQQPWLYIFTSSSFHLFKMLLFLVCFVNDLL